MGVAGQGVDKRIHRSPSLEAVRDHPLVVTARRGWPLDEQVHLLAAEVAITCEAELRGARRRVATEAWPTFGRTLSQTIRTVRQAERHFSGPETTAWVRESERGLLDATVARFGLETILLRLAESAVVAASSS